MSLQDFIYELNLAQSSPVDLPFVDYIVIGGQSNMDGRTSISSFDAKYHGPHSNVLVWTGNGLSQWLPDITTSPGRFAWDSIVLKDLADGLGVTLRVVKHTFGGTAIGKTVGADYVLDQNGSWNIAVTGSHWHTLRERMRAVIRYERDVNKKQARFRALFWDQGESDGDVLSYSQNYVTYSKGTLAGNFVDLVTAVRTTAGNSTMSVAFAQKMSTQADGYSANVIAAQTLFDTYDANAYMLAMNSNTARYPLQDQWHYSPTGVINLAADMISLITANNLLANWK